MKLKKSTINPCLFTMGVSTLAITSLFAAPIEWTGATNSDFATAENWLTNIAPVSDITSDIATFSGTPTANQPVLAAARSVKGLNFASPGWTLGGAGALTLGTGGIISTGDNTISNNLSVNNAGARVISVSEGGTLNLGVIATSGTNGNVVTFGSAGNTGTVVLGGSVDNNSFSATIAAGTVVMNKGTVNGTVNAGSAIVNAVVNVGATLKYGNNLTDRNGATVNGQGQIYNEATISGTLDLNGSGVISDNYSIQKLIGNTNTGAVVNTGSGSAQLRIVTTENVKVGFNGTISGATSLYFNILSEQAINNAANTFTGGVEVAKGFARFASDGSLGAVPATPTINITLNGDAATLMNSGGPLTIDANRQIFLGAAGGAFKAGWTSALTVNGAITGPGRLRVIPDGGSLVLAGANTYTGNTLVDNVNSRLTLADDGSLKFNPGTNGISNKVLGSATSQGTVTFNGDFVFDLTNAEVANGNSWTIVDTASVIATYGTTFTVAGFTESNDVWTKTSGNTIWSYSEITGKLTVAVTGSVPNITLGSANTTSTGGVIYLNDVSGGSVTTAGPITFVLYKNGVEVPSSVVITKVNGVNSVTFTAAVEPNTSYTYSITFPVTGIPGVTTKTITGTLSSPVMPPTLAGPEGSVGVWGIREYRVAGANNLNLAYAATSGTNLQFEGTAPVLNHHDPDTNTARSSGNFNNDFPILSDAAGNQDFVVVAKTKVSIPAAGDYTFSVHTDDGFAMRVNGGQFVSKSGIAAIDPLDKKTLYYNGGATDSDSRGVFHFDAAGTYDILFLNFDGSGGGFYELAWAPGAFAEDKDTNTWTLVGNTAGLPPYLPRYLANVPGPKATAGNFGIRTYLTPGVPADLNSVSDFLAATNRLPTDADGLTTDIQSNVLNFADPENRGDGGVALPDRPFPGDTSVDNNNVITTAKGRISVTTAGLYTFGVNADDGYILRFKGLDGIPNPVFKRVTGVGKFEMSNPNELFSGTGGSRGIINLAVGSYDVEFIHTENTGAMYYELVSAPGEWPTGTTPPDGWTLVGYQPTVTSVAVPKIKAPGWAVEAAFSDPTLPMNGTIFTAEESLLIASQKNPLPANFLTQWPQINFEDPEAKGIGNTFANASPFPINTSANDNNFAVRATGTVVITVAGEYFFGFQGDDGGSLTISGGPGDPPFWKRIVASKDTAVIDSAFGLPGTNNRISVDKTSTNSRTIAAVDLVPGEYTLSGVYFEMTNDSFWALFGAQGTDSPTTTLPLLSTTGATTVAVTGSKFPLLAQSVAPVDSPFNITGFTTTGSPINGASFTFSSANAGTYAVQVSTDLANWSTINATITNKGNGTSGVSANFAGQLINGQPILGQPKLFVRVVRTF